MNSRNRSYASDDRGGAAVLLAITLVVLLGFAALAVDSGIAFDDRRQQQSAADFGALAASQFARTGSAAVHPDCTGLTLTDFAACRGAEEALRVINGTLAGRFTDADWDTCVDPNKPSDYSQSSFISDCISFTANMQRVRVVLPGTEIETAFAGVMGFDSLDVGAFAEASVDLDIIGGVLPFAIGPGGAGSNQACFFAQATPTLNIEPCDGPAQGNFGKLNVRLYGNSTYGTPEICSGGIAQRMATNIITGSDHPLEPTWRVPGTVNDNINCAAITNPVDQVEVWTGNAAGALGEGFFGGIATPGLEGRLLCKGSLSSSSGAREAYPLGTHESEACVDINNSMPEAIDHTPLWSYVDAGVSSAVGGACTPGGGSIKDRVEMEACLAAWKALPDDEKKSFGGSLFTNHLGNSPRFGGVPILHADPGTGFAAYNIIGFLPVYIETIYFSCAGTTCTTVHSPGEASIGPCPNPLTSATSSCGWPRNGYQLIEAVTVFILSLDMLTDEIAEKFPYREGTIAYNLHR